jgi:hypothetical protein
MKNVISVSQEAFDNGAKVAVCSTSNEKAVQGIVDTMLPEFADRCAFFSRTPRLRAIPIDSIRFDSIRPIVEQVQHTRVRWFQNKYSFKPQDPGVRWGRREEQKTVAGHIHPRR